MTDVYDQYRRDLWHEKADAYQQSFESLCAYPVPLLLDAVGALVRGCRSWTSGVALAALARLRPHEGPG